LISLRITSMKSVIPNAGALARVAGILALTAVVSLWSAQAMAVDGMITVPSSHGPIETMNKFEAEVNAKGMIVFARIDHAAGAAAVGLSLRPTELLMFGNAKGGTPLMQSAQTMGIDLPLKTLVWQDQSGSYGFRTMIRVGSQNDTASAPCAPRLMRCREQQPRRGSVGARTGKAEQSDDSADLRLIPDVQRAAHANACRPQTTRRYVMKKFIAALALITLIAVPTLTVPASAASVSPSSSSFGDNGY
jgi:uncharacterized protein (DUF302 family)